MMGIVPIFFLVRPFDACAPEADWQVAVPMSSQTEQASQPALVLMAITWEYSASGRFDRNHP
jgi:hypothetical protein